MTHEGSASRANLKALFLIRENEILFSRKFNYDDDRILGEHGFQSWADLNSRGGFAVAQCRPHGEIFVDPKTGNQSADHLRYDAPFSEWKWNLRHQAFELPDWLHVGPVRRKCRDLLNEWARYHIVRSGTAVCEKGQALLALGTAKIVQRGGIVWAYERATIEQTPDCRGLAHFLDTATGVIYGRGKAYDRSRATIFPGGQCERFGEAIVDIQPGPPPQSRPMEAIPRNGINLPFGVPVD